MGVEVRPLDAATFATTAPSPSPPRPARGLPSSPLADLGPISIASTGACEAGYNCFESSHIPGHDITCKSGVTEKGCAQLCCDEPGCLGFDFIEEGGRCCTSSISRADGPFEFNGCPECRSCEKNSVTGFDASFTPKRLDFASIMANSTAAGLLIRTVLKDGRGGGGRPGHQ